MPEIDSDEQALKYSSGESEDDDANHRATNIVVRRGRPAGKKNGQAGVKQKRSSTAPAKQTTKSQATLKASTLFGGTQKANCSK